MNRKKIAKLRKEFNSLWDRRKNLSPDELEKFAKKCGRNRRGGSMGKEPTYINDYLIGSKPLNIPHHSKNNTIGTATSILTLLESDLDQLSELFKD